MENTVGDRLKQARSNARLTQEDVSQKLGLSSKQLVSSYETGKSSPAIETLKGMIELYGVSSDWLLFGSDSKRKQPAKTTAELVLQLLEAAESLGLTLATLETTTITSCDYGTDGFIHGDGDCFIHNCIILESKCNYVLSELFDDIMKLQNVRGILDMEDYQTLVEKRVHSKLDEANYDYSNGELPF